MVADGAGSAEAARAEVQDARMAGCLGIVYTTTPFFLSMMHSSESFTMMVRTYPTFFFFGPTILADFFAYSVARYDDVSWGTKAVAATAKAPPGLAAKAATKARARASAAAGGGGGGRGASGASRRAALSQALKTTEARESNASSTLMASIVQFVLCVAVAGVNLRMHVVSHYLLYFGLTLSGVGYLSA
jgi:hypothetical protein